MVSIRCHDIVRLYPVGSRFERATCKPQSTEIVSNGFLRVASEWSNFPPPLTVGKGALQNAAKYAIIDFGQAATAWSSYRGKLMVRERRPGVHRVPEEGHLDDHARIPRRVV